MGSLIVLCIFASKQRAAWVKQVLGTSLGKFAQYHNTQQHRTQPSSEPLIARLAVSYIAGGGHRRYLFLSFPEHRFEIRSYFNVEEINLVTLVLANEQCYNNLIFG